MTINDLARRLDTNPYALRLVLSEHRLPLADWTEDQIAFIRDAIKQMLMSPLERRDAAIEQARKKYGVEIPRWVRYAQRDVFDKFMEDLHARCDQRRSGSKRTRPRYVA